MKKNKIGLEKKIKICYYKKQSNYFEYEKEVNIDERRNTSKL